MYKVHKPHLDSGYLSTFQHEPIRDAEGQADWALVYGIGPRARAEFAAFTKKHPQQQLLIGNTEDAEQLVEQGREEAPKEDHPLLAELTGRGVTAKHAKKILDSVLPGQNILDQLEWGDQIIGHAKGTFRNPPGFYVSLIRDNISPPADFETSRTRQMRLEAQRAHEAKLIERQRFELAYDHYQEKEIDRYINEQVPGEQFQQAIAAKRKELQRQFPSLPAKTLDEVSARAARTNFRTHAPVIPFEAFCQAHREEILSGALFSDQ